MILFKGLDGIVNFTREQMQHIERRGEQRIQVLDPHRQLSHRHSNRVIQVDVIDLNYFGLLISLDHQTGFSFCQ